MRTSAKTFLVRFGLGMAIGLIQTARANVRLPSVFSDHAVLQQGVPLPVWGWADPGEDVTVSLAGQTRSIKGGATGMWRVTFDALQTGNTLTLTVQGKNTITVRDILAGEVWLGSGQSNMAMTVNRCNDYEKERAAANFPTIRMFTVERVVGTEPKTECQGQWIVCASNTVGGFSATAYFMGRELQRKLDVPVGLINSSWGGTPIEAWISAEAFTAVPAFKPIMWINGLRGPQSHGTKIRLWPATGNRSRPGRRLCRRPRPPGKKRPARPKNRSIRVLIRTIRPIFITR